MDAKTIADAYMAATSGLTVPKIAYVNGAVINQIRKSDECDPTAMYLVRDNGDGTAVIVPAETVTVDPD